MNKQNRDKKSSSSQRRGNPAKSAAARKPEEFQQNQAENREQDYGREIADKHRLERDNG